MIYPENFEQKIGFDIIRHWLSERCLSSLGEQFVDEISFSPDFEPVQAALEQTSEFRQLLEMNNSFPAVNYYNLVPELHHINTPGTYLVTERLLELRLSLQTISDCIDFIAKLDEKRFHQTRLLAEGIHIDGSLLRSIDRIMDHKGHILDHASEELGKIRKSIQRKQSQVDQRLSLTLKVARTEGWTESNAEITIRNGRLVIPVASPHKRKIRGIVHDESATGQTVFIEPEEVFEINNEVRELEIAENREIVRILKEITDQIRPYIPEFETAYYFLGKVDFIRAKALLALSVRAFKPDLTREPLIEWFRAVHPLLFLNFRKLKKEVVPMNLTLDKNDRILIISGPNAGGKSVCLKTTGLLQYMLQCGLLIPVKEGSRAGLFRNIFIDIGDDQSLDNDLSTYSSHLLNMKNLLDVADESTLFLIDEFGAGTEPQLGGAIAEAVLEKLNERSSFGVITTHYTNLKLMAGKNGIINGAMLFDNIRMMPLYELKTGIPGSSFAFEIAERIGLPGPVLDQAREKTGTRHLDFEQQIQQLEVEKKNLETKHKQFETADEILAAMIQKYNAMYAELQAGKRKIMDEARREAAGITAKANQLIEKTVKEIKEAQASKQSVKTAHTRVSGLRQELEQKTPIENEVKENIPEEPAFDPEIRPGDTVRLVETGATGRVVALVNDEISVEFGSVMVKLGLSKVEKLDPAGVKDTPARRRSKGVVSEISERRLAFNDQIDLRGKRAEEALGLITRYVDEAILLNIGEIRILHGKGYGILRELIHNYLKTVPQVRAFFDEKLERGGHGITIVQFK